MCIYLTDGSTNVLINVIDIQLRNCPTRPAWTIAWSRVRLLIDENTTVHRKIRGQSYASKEDLVQDLQNALM